MSTNPNHEIKKESIDNDDDQAEILSEITCNNQNRNNVIYTTSVPVKSEFNTTTANNQKESNKDEKIKQLEQMQEMLFEKIRTKSNENEILKQNETNLKAKNSELNRIIEKSTNNQMNLSNEIEKIFEANETIELKKNDIIDLKIQIDKYELKINEMNQKLKESNISLNYLIDMKDEKIKELEQMQKILMETVQIKTNEIEILKQSETNLKDKNNELNSTIEINTNNHINLSNEITSLKDNLLEAQKTIETKTNKINDLKMQIDKCESIRNETNQELNDNSTSNIDFNNQISLQEEHVANETIEIKTNEIYQQLKVKPESNIDLNNQIIFQDENTINDLVVTQTTSQSIDLPPQSEEYKNLELNLKGVKLLVNDLNSFESQSFKRLNKHCREQKRLVQSATELKIEVLGNKSKKRKYDETNNEEENIDKINRSNKELIEEIDNYQQTCIKEFSHKTSTIKVLFKLLVDEAIAFLDKKQRYLKENQTSNDEIKMFNLESLELQSKLHKELKKQKYLIFNNKKIQFIDETDESTSLGYFDYDECFKFLCRKSYGTNYDEFTVELFDIESNELIKNFNYKNHEYIITCIKYVPDNMIICGTGNGLIKILNVETAQCIQTINAHTNIVNNILLISPKTFLTCSQDSTVKYFDLDTFACTRTFTGHSYSVYTINRLSTDKFVSSSLDCTIRIWSLNKSKCLKVIEADSCRNLIVISDKIIISHKGKSLFIWNVKTGTKTGEIEINDQYVMSFIKLSSTKIATGHKNGIIKIWDIRTQKCLQTIEKTTPWCLTKLSNSLIVFGYDSSIIKILDINTDNCIKSLESEIKVKLETIGIDLF